MRRFLRFAGAGALTILTAQSPAIADTIYRIDVFNSQLSGTVSSLGSTHTVYFGGEGGWPGYDGVQTATYHFNATGIADFGTLVFEPGFVSCTRGCLFDYGAVEYAVFFGAYYLGSWELNRDPNAWQYTLTTTAVVGTGAQCTSIDPGPCTAPQITQTHNLLIPVSAGDDLTLFWGGFPDFRYEYIAPVPEPSTWAMLLIGFAGIGFATRIFSRDTKNSKGQRPIGAVPGENERKGRASRLQSSLE